MSRATGSSPGPSADGTVELYRPGGWIDLLEEPHDADVTARARFADLLRATLPTADDRISDAGVEALMAWRARMLAQGVISHGMINVPLDALGEPVSAEVAESADRWASWHILTAVVAVPPTSPELDLGEFVALVFGQHLNPASSYVESFATEIGCGTGLLLTPELDPADGGTEHADQPTHYGLAVALACPPGGGNGLLVTGACVDPGEIAALGAVVAVIAARSRIRTSPPESLASI